MTDTAVQDIEQHVSWAKRAALNLERRERTLGIPGCVGPSSVWTDTNGRTFLSRVGTGRDAGNQRGCKQCSTDPQGATPIEHKAMLFGFFFSLITHNSFPLLQ